MRLNRWAEAQNDHDAATDAERLGIPSDPAAFVACPQVFLQLLNPEERRAVFEIYRTALERAQAAQSNLKGDWNFSDQDFYDNL